MAPVSPVGQNAATIGPRRAVTQPIVAPVPLIKRATLNSTLPLAGESRSQPRRGLPGVSSAVTNVLPAVYGDASAAQAAVR